MNDNTALEIFKRRSVKKWLFLVFLALCITVLLGLAWTARLNGIALWIFFSFAGLVGTLGSLLFKAWNRKEISYAFISILMESRKGCYWEWDLTSGRFTMIPKGRFLFGKDLDTYSEFVKLLHPDDVHLFRKIEARLADSKLPADKTFEVDFRIQSAQGEWHWFVAQSDASGRHTPHAAGFMMDINSYKRAMEALQASENRATTIFRSAPGSVAVTDREGKLLEANRAFHDMLGYSAGELQGRFILSLSDVHYDRAGGDVMTEILERCGGGKDLLMMEEDFVRRDGERITLNYGLSVILDFDGNIVNYIFAGTDITLEKQRVAELRLLAEKEQASRAELDTYNRRLHQLHELIHSLLRTRDSDRLLEGMLEYLKNVVSDSACAVYFFSRDKSELKLLAQYGAENISVPDDGQVMKTITQKAPVTFTDGVGRETRQICPIAYQEDCVGAVDLYKPSGLSPDELKMYQLLVDYVSGFWMLYDVISRREEEAFIDPLTGIWNRRYMLRRMEEESERIARYGGNACLIIGDMGNFKYVNDNFGHAKGDEILTKSAGAIKKVLRLADSLGRYGGDEFIILLSNVAQEEAEIVLTRIRDALGQLGIRSDDADPDSPLLSVVMDFGIALYPGAANTLLDTIKLADEAMYARKMARKALDPNSKKMERR